MANIASQRKRNARSLREHDENRHFKSAVKTHFKRLEAAVSGGDGDALSWGDDDPTLDTGSPSNDVAAPAPAEQPAS